MTLLREFQGSGGGGDPTLKIRVLFFKMRDLCMVKAA